MAWMRRSGPGNFALTERAVVDGLRAAAVENHWNVVSPSTHVKSDLTMVEPGGDAIVCEVRTGRGPMHFGSVAQVVSVVDELRELPGLSAKQVRGVIVTTEEVGQGVQEMANELGISIVAIDADQPNIGRRAFARIARPE